MFNANASSEPAEARVSVDVGNKTVIHEVLSKGGNGSRVTMNLAALDRYILELQQARAALALVMENK